MKVEKRPINETLGHILLHHQTDSNGRRILKKGILLSAEDVETLHSLDCQEIYVGILGGDDLLENEAARLLGEVVFGAGIVTSTPTTGRVNLITDRAGLFKVDVESLYALNSLNGITLATGFHNSSVQAKKIVGTIKIIPYTIPRSRLEAARTIALKNRPLVRIKPFILQQAYVMLIGSEFAEEKVTRTYIPPLQNRLSDLGIAMEIAPYLSQDVEIISEALHRALAKVETDIIVIAGETSIVDENDIIPQAIRAVGGEIIQYGVAVEPGNLLLMAHYHQKPILGVPGCARSKKFNVIDMILPRLAAGEQLTRHDLIALSHGGYVNMHD